MEHAKEKNFIFLSASISLWTRHGPAAGQNRVKQVLVSKLALSMEFWIILNVSVRNVRHSLMVFKFYFHKSVRLIKSNIYKSSQFVYTRFAKKLRYSAIIVQAYWKDKRDHWPRVQVYKCLFIYLALWWHWSKKGRV